MTIKNLQHFINGKWVDSESNSNSNYLENVNPADGRVLSLVPIANEKIVDQAIKSAQDAFQSWSHTTLETRAQILTKIGDLILKYQEELVELECLDTGKLQSFAKMVDIPRSAHNFHFFAKFLTLQSINRYLEDSHGHEHFIKRYPLGVVTVIAPWNLPLYLLTWKIAPALITGNCVVAKPSELTPSTAHFLGKIFLEAGLPAGVCNIIHGTGPITGQALVDHPLIKAISFTGSTKTGKMIAQSAAKNLKKVALEMGGKNAAIIFTDCDIEKAVDTTLRSSFNNQGQICLCTSRILIQEEIYTSFKEKFIQKAKQFPVGHLISKEHAQKVNSYLELAKKLGGIILTGGVWKNNSLEPTVIENLDNSCAFHQEEIFGPVVGLIPFKNTQDAIHMANNSPYGLSACIWSTNQQTIKEVSNALDVGMVWVNDWMIRDLRTPFGGVKESGFAKEGGMYAVDFFTTLKTITI